MSTALLFFLLLFRDHARQGRLLLSGCLAIMRLLVSLCSCSRSAVDFINCRGDLAEPLPSFPDPLLRPGVAASSKARAFSSDLIKFAAGFPPRLLPLPLPGPSFLLFGSARPPKKLGASKTAGGESGLLLRVVLVTARLLPLELVDGLLAAAPRRTFKATAVGVSTAASSSLASLILLTTFGDVLALRLRLLLYGAVLIEVIRGLLLELGVRRNRSRPR